MTKRELLIQVCEHPGFPPSGAVDESTGELLRELANEGWIQAQQDGWFATAKALLLHPDFEETADGSIVEPEPESVGDPPRVVGVITLEGCGYEITQNAEGRYETTEVKPGSRRSVLGHYDSIVMLARITELLAVRVT